MLPSKSAPNPVEMPPFALTESATYGLTSSGFFGPKNRGLRMTKVEGIYAPKNGSRLTELPS